MKDIPADVMGTAIGLVSSEQVSFHSYGTVITDTRTVEAIALAILAERERCLTEDHIIRHMDETALTGIVMTLTGGSANPSVVRSQIARLRS